MTDITDPKWLASAPDLPGKLPSRWRDLWDHAWALHQRSCRPPLAMLDDTWQTVGVGYFMPAFGHWDIVHNALDMLVYDADFAARQICLVVKTLRDSDGRLPGLVREFSNEKGCRILKPDYDYSPPPLWPVAALEVFRRTGNKAFLRTVFAGAAKGLAWWEANRRLANHLFWFADCVGNAKWESGYDACPRWDALERNAKPFACVDLCAQMGMYYDSLADMAESLGRGEDASRWRASSQRLAEAVRTMLWHDEDGLFYDRRPEGGRWVRVKTVACFWPMVAGQATAEQARRLAEHAADADEFSTRVPVPSVAANDPAFGLDCWRGPTWLSQTYWIVRGLSRYGFKGLADRIATSALDGAAQAFAEYGTVFEFLHPHGGPNSDLGRKGKSTGPCRDYLGHNPIHALAMKVADKGTT